MITALLLAAGEGRRMNHQVKALLRFADRTFIEQSLMQLEGVVDEIIVVTGAYREDVQPFIKAPVREAFNAVYPTGLLSSIQCGLRAVHSETAAVVISLVDLPFLRSIDYQSAIASWQPGTILRSMSRGEPAHPVVIAREFFAEILDQPPSDRGCAFLFQAHPDRVLIHDCPPGRIDIDSIEDYHAHFTS